MPDDSRRGGEGSMREQKGSSRADKDVVTIFRDARKRVESIIKKVRRGEAVSHETLNLRLRSGG